MKTKVYIKDGKDLRSAINKTFAEFKIKDLRNKKVFVKPNMLRIARPEECVITDPRLIEAVVSHLLNNSANVIVGDNPIPQKVNEIEVANYCGFLDAARGRFRNIGKYVKRIKLKNNSVREIYVSRDILDAELLISLPKLKTHELTILSVAVKNQFGIIPGGLKPKLHFQCPTLDDFCRLLIEVYNIRKPDLIIVDALNIVDARGRMYRLDKLIAGQDAWAVDYVCALFIGIKPETSPLIRIGIKEKLFNPEDIEIVGDLTPIKKFSTPISMPLKDFFAGIGSRIFAQIQNFYVPVIDQSLCNKCRSCENVCPARAIIHFNIDHKKCIRCYCCFEVCPRNAIKRKPKVI
ncbi:MAG: DUF362 domain-containing protein [candidate division WOR-3 bacterium]